MEIGLADVAVFGAGLVGGPYTGALLGGALSGGLTLWRTQGDWEAAAKDAVGGFATGLAGGAIGHLLVKGVGRLMTGAASRSAVDTAEKAATDAATNVDNLAKEVKFLEDKAAGFDTQAAAAAGRSKGELEKAARDLRNEATGLERQSIGATATKNATAAAAAKAKAEAWPFQKWLADRAGIVSGDAAAGYGRRAGTAVGSYTGFHATRSLRGPDDVPVRVVDTFTREGMRRLWIPDRKKIEERQPDRLYPEKLETYLAGVA